ncbi:MAG: zinc ribbon domain-containing protein [Candidatus Caldarchaeum sp.]
MSIDSYYEYPAGVGLSKFLEGLKHGKLTASLCRRCGARRIPPKSYCLECMKPSDEYVEVAPLGSVEAYTRCEVGLDGSKAGDVVWVFIKFEGVAGGLLHRLDPSAEPRKGLKVRPVFHEHRAGSVLDIKWFRPAE